MLEKDTICAIATPPGTGAIAVIRLSGTKTLSICDKIFYSPSGKKISEQAPNTVHFGEIKDENKIIDEVLITIFKAPYSYTGEDVAEISCHGSPFIQQQIVQLLINKGARMATAGEYTMRAFMNGKMDLSQAEAVADLIASSSEAAKNVALQQMRGGFSNEIKQLRKQLLDFISLVELELDFSEEDVEFADRRQLNELMREIEQSVKKLLQSFELGNVIKNGVPVAIAGEPNVGKSTLLNVLLNEEKAIVSEIAGTTRDVIEDIINIGGISFRFIDTAGLRETSDKVETLGIKKTLEKLNQAAIVILMVDAADDKIIHKIKDTQQKIKNLDTKKMIVVVNKMDTINNTHHLKAIEKYNTVVYISAKNKKNIQQLTNLLLETVNVSQINQQDVIVTNARHLEALQNAHQGIIRALTGLEQQISGDLLAQDIREVLHYLGEITGEISTEDVLGNIFENFCIGK